MIRINLAPVLPRPRGAPFPFPLIFGVAVLAVLGSLTGVWWRAIREERRLAHRLARASEELAPLKATLGREMRLREQVADLTERIRTLQALARAQGTPPRVLDALVDAVPRAIRLTTLEGHGLELRALGSAVSATAVADLLSRLYASGRFTNVTIVVSRRDLEKGDQAPLSFEITCRFEG